MNRTNFTQIVYLIGIIMVIPVIVLVPCIAQEETGTLSGTVLDTEGKPISGFTITLSPLFLMTETDEKGAFTFANVAAGPVQFVIPVQPFMENEKSVFNPEPDDEIVSTKIEGITLYQDRQPPFGGIRFGVKPGSNIENIEVIVRQRMRIRARVVFKDGKPLANASMSRSIRHQSVDGGGSGSSSGGGTTDAEGYFVQYIDNDDVPANYTVSVKYKGLSAKSEEFLLEEGARYDDLVLTLDGNAPPAAPTQPTRSAESLPNILRKVTGARKPSEKPTPSEPAVPVKQPTVTSTPSKKPTPTEIRPTVPARQMKHPSEKNTWVVNPENGHAYKKIRCSSLDDAKNRANAEGAHLVAINDEAEQKWLSGIFGNHLYWIGLSDAENEGEWVWQNGEPLTYANWGSKSRFPRSTLSVEKRDSAIMTFVNGQWHAVGPGDLFWHMAKMAILEKYPLQTGEDAEGK